MTPEENKTFYVQLLKDIPYFHKLYAKYHNPDTLETIKNLETYSKKIKP